MEAGSRSRLRNERGFTLVEVLAALTIMALISVTIIGYFASAMNRSKEESRRVIASNLARLKAAEIRDFCKELDLASGKTKFQLLRDNMTEDAAYDRSAALPAPLESTQLSDTLVNGTSYRYVIQLSRDGGQMTELSSQMGASLDAASYLIQMQVSVLWDDGNTGSAAKSTTLDTYVVDRR